MGMDKVLHNLAHGTLPSVAQSVMASESVSAAVSGAPSTSSLAATILVANSANASVAAHSTAVASLATRDASLILSLNTSGPLSVLTSSVTSLTARISAASH